MLLFRAQESLEIDAEPKHVFDVVADVERHPELGGSGEVQTIRKTTEGPVAIGTVLVASEKVVIAGRASEPTATSRITTFDPPSRMAWLTTVEGLGGPPMRRIEWQYDVQSLRGGRARLTQALEVEPKSVLGWLVLRPVYRRVRGGRVQAGMRRGLENVKAAAERR